MAYILNSIPTNSVPIPVELWVRHKPSLQHYRIWGCLAYVLKGKTGKLETKSELYYFVEYSKGTTSWLFYGGRLQIVLLSTNVVFMEDGYMMDRKPNDRFDLRELSDTPREALEGSSNPIEDVLETITS